MWLKHHEAAATGRAHFPGLVVATLALAVVMNDVSGLDIVPQVDSLRACDVYSRAER